MAETHQLQSPNANSDAFRQLNLQAEKLAKSCPCADVPSLDHLKLADYDVVYEPSDDTFLLLDCLAHEYESKLKDEDQKRDLARVLNTTLEIGCGTGVCTVFLAKLLADHLNDIQQQSIKHHVTDINEDAIRIARDTANASKLDMDTIDFHLCDLATPLLETLHEKIDVLIFNPPYVPTPDNEVGSSGIEASWAGGTDGRVVLDRALPQISHLLSRPHGVAYIITVDDNKPEEIAHLMLEKYQIEVKPIVRRRARNEYLSVLKMSRSLVS